ncbi:hypothetical protein CGLO_17994 [Colletotrichum gloeosporioides Cg-14]|uniref:Uncharacterized protein n=1 Tax=Colletotrichum gloeosporioides (strain Cg-14) TaxID=1237896 RepID=T0JIW3_COLGC|nr:hypothetical protein CGLO_17994 [Colletotrichum gloeosporioides Cg-14]
MQDYLNQHVIYQLDIKDARGEYTKQQLISKLIRRLTELKEAYDRRRRKRDTDKSNANIPQPTNSSPSPPRKVVTLAEVNRNNLF